MAGQKGHPLSRGIRIQPRNKTRNPAQAAGSTITNNKRTAAATAGAAPTPAGRRRGPVLNRHERRRTAALAHGRRTGYLHRVTTALGNGAKPMPGVHLATIEHDHWCAIFEGGDCNCSPNISVSHPSGDVTIV